VDKAVMTTREAAEYLGVSKSFLEHRRAAGRPPAYFKVGARVRYRMIDLDAYVEDNLQPATAVAR
jgi:excisionase family DNA binding protein